MILHSIVPPELIFPNEEPPSCEILHWKGRTLEGRRSPEGFQVSRILSTDPGSFLDGSCFPGQTLSLTPSETAPGG